MLRTRLLTLLLARLLTLLLALTLQRAYAPESTSHVSPSSTLPSPTPHVSPSTLPPSRFVHLQNDDILVSLTGAASYVIELKTRASPNLLIDQTHPYCYSMTPFQARLQLPHAEVRASRFPLNPAANPQP